MKLTVYAVIVSYTNDILSSELDQIYPTAESAVSHAKELAKYPNVYRVQVDKDAVSEKYGRYWLSTIYEEEHEERY